MRTDDDFVQINELALDQEWLRQPNLFHAYALKLADARKDYNEAEDRLSIAEAEVSLAIRRDPLKYHLDKVTEDAIKVRVALHERVRLATSEVNIARHEVDVLTAATRALEHKKTALENLVILHGQDYFSSPIAPKEVGRELKQRIEDSEKQRTRNPKR